MSRPREWAAFVFLGVLAWGTSFLWIKIALRELGPLSVVMYRMAFGVLGAWLITRALKKPILASRRQLVQMLALGIVNTAIPVALITWAETRIDSGLAGVLNGTMPLFTILFAHFILPEDRFTAPKIAGLIAGFSGLVLLMLRDLGPQGLAGSLLGQLAVVLAAILYAGSNVYVRLKLRGQHPIHTAAVSLTSSLIVMIVLVALFEPHTTPPRLPLTWLAVAWMGLVGLSLAYYAYFYLINAWGATRTAVVTYVFPVTAVTLGVIFLGEHPSWHLFIGGTLIIGGIALVNVRTHMPE